MKPVQNISEALHLHVIRPLDKPLLNVSESYYIGGEAAEEAEKGKATKNSHSWVRQDNNFFITRKPNTETVPAGIYDLGYSETEGVFLALRAGMVDELFSMPTQDAKVVTEDLTKFWLSRDKYDQYGLVYKRGILMHGPPGSGKTSIINLIASHVINSENGIVINASNLSMLMPMMHSLRAIEPDRKLLVIFEDFDSFIYENSTKTLLNLLDGNMQVDNVVYIATTNYLDRIEPRIKFRPSRFDRLIEVPVPDAEAREFFIKKKLLPEDITRLGEVEIQRWVNDTDQMSFAHIRELIAACCCMDQDYNETISRLREMREITNESN